MRENENQMTVRHSKGKSPLLPGNGGLFFISSTCVCLISLSSIYFEVL